MPDPDFIITGATGFIAGHLVRHLHAQRQSALLLSRRPPPLIPEGFQWQEWQANHPIRLPTNFPRLCVLHLATRHHIENPTPEDDILCHDINVLGTRRLLADCTAAGISRFIYFSTIKAAPPATDSNPRRESDPELDAPNTAYGRSKLDAEREVAAWSAQSPSRHALILRPAVVFGPGNTANVFRLMRAIAQRRFFLAGPNTNVKSVVSVSNLVAATLFLAARTHPGCDQFYLIERENYSVRQFATLVSQSLNRHRPPPTLPVPLLRLAARLGDLLRRTFRFRPPLTSQQLDALLEHSAFSCSKLQAAGFTHPATTVDALAEMAAWMKFQRGGTP